MIQYSGLPLNINELIGFLLGWRNDLNNAPL